MMTNTFKSHREFIKNPGWSIHSKGKDGVKLYTRVSSSKLFCVKSVANVRGKVEDFIKFLSNIELKPKFDDTCEFAHYVSDTLPYDSAVSYFRFKKVLVVSPRDVLSIGKNYRINENLAYLIGNSITMESVPHVKNVVRGETSVSGWRIKVIEDGEYPLCKIMFYSEADFKISLFIAKQAGPKSGNLAYAF